MTNTENKEITDLNHEFLYSLMKGVRRIFILWLISKEKIHGYALINIINEAVSQVPEAKVVHGSTIYPILHQLKQEGLITSSVELNGKKKVKAYEITDKGLELLNLIKKVVRSRPQNDIMLLFIKDMIFSKDHINEDQQNLGGEDIT